MRKLLLLLIVLMPASAIFGQTTKGKFVLSGGTGLQFTGSNVKYVSDGETYGESNTNSFSFVPTFGYFVMDNLAVGLSGSISTSREKYPNLDKSISNSIIMPTALYYFPLDGKIRPLVQIGVGYSSTESNFAPKDNSSHKETYRGPAFNFGGGISYFITEKISFNFGLLYTKSILTNSDQINVKYKGDFGSNIGISVFL